MEVGQGPIGGCSAIGKKKASSFKALYTSSVFSIALILTTSLNKPQKKQEVMVRIVYFPLILHGQHRKRCLQ
jgi:hypothetical protein